MSFKAAMELPNIYRRSENEIHTASDGQKFEGGPTRSPTIPSNILAKARGSAPTPSSMTRSILALSGFQQGGTRERVIDGLMRNDVVKSDIHSTDTHGFSRLFPRVPT